MSVNMGNNGVMDSGDFTSNCDQSNQCNNCVFPTNQINCEEFPQIDRVQQQRQLDLQKQQQILDYKDVSDTFMSLLSTAEAIAFQNSNEKELGYYDEFDTANRKTENSQIIQFLRLLREFDGIRDDYEKAYKEKYNFPKKITKDYIEEKIDSFFNKIGEKNKLAKYFEEIVNIINRNKKININEELKKYYRKDTVTDKEAKKNRWDNLIGIKHLFSEEDKKTIDEYIRTGNYEYKVEFNKKPGRYCCIIFDKNNKKKKIEVYTESML